MTNSGPALTLVLLYRDKFAFANSVYLHLLCLSFSMRICINNLDQLISWQLEVGVAS